MLAKGNMCKLNTDVHKTTSLGMLDKGNMCDGGFISETGQTDLFESYINE